MSLFEDVVKKQAENDFGPKPESNPIGDAVINQVNRDNVAFTTSNDIAMDKQPDRQAEVAKISREFKVPASFADSNLEDFKREKKKRELEQIKYENPGLTKYMSDPNKAAMVQDDLDKMKRIDYGAGRFRQAKESVGLFGSVYEVARESKIGIDNNIIGLEKSLLYQRYVNGSIGKQEFIDEVGKRNKTLANRAANRPQYYKDWQDKMGKVMPVLSKSWAELSNAFSEFNTDETLKSLARIVEAKDNFDWAMLGWSGVMVSSPSSVIISNSESAANMFAPTIAAGLAAPAGGFIGGAGGAAIGTAIAGPIGGFAGLGVGATSGAVTASLAAAGYTSAAMEYGMQMEEYLRDKMESKGLDINNPEHLSRILDDKKVLAEVKDKAWAKAFTTAAVDAVGTVIGAKFMKGGSRQAEQLAQDAIRLKNAGKISEAVEMIADAKKLEKASKVKGFIEGQVTETLGEAGSEAAGQYAAEKDISKVQPGEVLAEGVGALIMGNGFGALTHALTTGKNITVGAKENIVKAASQLKDLRNETQHTLEIHEQIKQLVEDVKTSKLNERDIESVKEFVDESSENADVYFQADEFEDHWKALGENPIEKADELLPGGRTDLEKAKSENSAIRVPLADYVTKFSEEESFEGLSQIMRKEPGAFSVKEANSISANIPSMLQELGRQAKKEREKIRREIKSRDEIGKHIQKQYEIAGRSKKESKALGQIFGSVINELAGHLGVNPETLLNKRVTRIQSFDEVPSGEALFQKSKSGLLLRTGEKEVESFGKIKEVNVPKVPSYEKGAGRVTPENASAIKTELAKHVNKQLKNTPSGRMATITTESLNNFVDAIYEQYKDNRPQSRALVQQGLDALYNMAEIFNSSVHVANKGGMDVFMGVAQTPKASIGVKFVLDGDSLVEVVPVGMRPSKAAAAGGANGVGSVQQGAKEGKISVSDFLGIVNNMRQARRPREGRKFYFQKELQNQAVNVVNQDELGFYSRLETEVSGMDFKQIPAKDLLNRINKLGGIKKEELEWSGLELFLNDKGNEKVTKEEVQDVLKNNRIVISQVVLAEGGTAEMGYETSWSEPIFVPLSEYDMYLLDNEVEERVYEDISSIGSKYVNDDYLLERYIELYNEKAKEEELSLLPEDIESEKLGDVVNKEIDESVRDILTEERSESEREYFDGEDSYWATYKVVDANSDIEIWYRPEADGDMFYDSNWNEIEGATSLEEAKIRIIGDAIENGDIGTEGISQEAITRERDINDPLAEPKWEEYTVDGGENYREYLLTLPNIQGKFTYSHHFPSEIENYFIHIRVKDRVDEDGNKIFYIEELQSDWHQQGRQKGYAVKSEERTKLEARKDVIAKEQQKIMDSEEYIAGEAEIADASNKMSEELKRAQEKYDKVWDRYDKSRDEYLLIGKQLDEARIEERRNPDPKLTESLKKNIENILSKVDESREKMNKLNKEKDDLKRETRQLRDKIERTTDELTKNLDERTGLKKLMDENKEISSKLTSKIPDAPFKDTNTWIMVAIKRALRLAAEGGYDKIAWTPGDIHAERWNTFNHIDELRYKELPNEKFYIEVDYRQGDTANKEIDGSELENYFGKSIATKMYKAEGEQKGDLLSIRESNVKVDDMSLSPTYDKKMPSLFGKYIKKLDKKSKVGTTKVITGENVRSVYHNIPDDFSLESVKKKYEREKDNLTLTWSGQIKRFIELAEKENATTSEEFADISVRTLGPGPLGFIGGTISEEYGNETLESWSVDLTDDLKEKVSGGQPLYQKDEKVRGFLDLTDPEMMLIGLLKDADYSTGLHESAHAFLEYAKIVERELRGKDLNPRQKLFMEDIQSLLDEFGVASLDDVKTEHHEKFARMFEAYILEGKAPVSRLQSAFNTFKTWLMKIYKSIAGIERAGDMKLNLTPELKEVFNRLLASQEEINEAESQMGFSMDDTIRTFATIGMMESDEGGNLDRVLAAHEDARAEAELILYREHLRQLKKQKTGEYKKAKKAIKEKYVKIADESPLYIATDSIKSNTIGGNPTMYDSIKFNTDLLKEMAGDKFKDIPKSLYSKNGIDPDAVAQMLGFKNGKEMIEQIASNPSKKDFIDGMTQRELDKTFPDFMSADMQDELKKQAINAVHSDKRERALRLELELMLKNSPAQFKELATRIGRQLPIKKDVEKAAKAEYGNTTLREGKPYVYTRAEVKNRRDAVNKLVKGDFEGAVKAKAREIYNFALTKESTNFQVEQDKRIKKAKDRLTKSDKELAKIGNVDMLKAAQAIMNRFQLLTDAQSGRLQDYLDMLQRYDQLAYSKVKGLSDSLAGFQDKNYKDLTVNEFNEVMDSVEALYELAVEENKITVDGKKIEKEKVIGDLKAQLETINRQTALKEDTKFKKFKGQVLSVWANMTRVEHLMTWLDKHKMDGPFRKYLFNRANDGQIEYDKIKQEQSDKLVTITEKYFKRLWKDEKKINVASYFPGVDPELSTITTPELVMAMLHSGNESNKKKLLLGRGWGAVDENEMLDDTQYQRFIADMFDKGYLNKEIMDGVQAIWDMFEEFKPEIQKVHRQVFGYYFKEIEAEPVKTPFGEYRGGYVPAVTDPLLVDKAAMRENQATIEQMEMQYTFAQTPKGMTKERVAGYNKALSLDFRLLMSHVEKTARFVALEPVVHDLNKIINNDDFSEAMSQKNRFWNNEVLRPWLSRIATQETERRPDTAGGRVLSGFLRFMRRGSNQQIMTGHWYNAIENYTDIPGIVNELGNSNSIDGTKSLANALKRYTYNKKETIDFVVESSPYMKDRMENEMFDIAERYNEVTLGKDTVTGKALKLRDFLQKHTMFLQSALWQPIEVSSWLAAYEKEIRISGDEKKAVRSADKLIRSIVGGARAADVANIEAGNALQKVLLTYYSYFLNKINIVAYAPEGQKLRTYLMAMAAPAILSGILNKTLRQGWDSDDDESYVDDVADVFVLSQLRFAAAGVPGGSITYNWIEGQFTDAKYDDRLSISPIVGMIESARGLKNVITHDELKARDIRDMMTFFGFATGLPLRPVGKGIGYMIENE